MLQEKKNRIVKWIHDKTHICTAEKQLTSDLKTHRQKVREWKKVFHAKGNKKKSQGTNTYIQQNRFEKEVVTRDKDTT